MLWNTTRTNYNYFFVFERLNQIDNVFFFFFVQHMTSHVLRSYFFYDFFFTSRQSWWQTNVSTGTIFLDRSSKLILEKAALVNRTKLGPNRLDRRGLTVVHTIDRSQIRPLAVCNCVNEWDQRRLSWNRYCWKRFTQSSRQADGTFRVIYSENENSLFRLLATLFVNDERRSIDGSDRQ